MIKKTGLLLVILVLALTFSIPAMATESHNEINGCQAEGESYLIKIGPPWGINFGPCCVRGYYEDWENNGFPGGCCKNREPNHDQSPGRPDNPGQGVWSSVGWQCECPDVREQPEPPGPA
jgi:hypothetical protein